MVRFKNAARDAYEKAEETDKPQLAGIAAKISCFLEAVDKKGISGILRDDSILFSEKQSCRLSFPIQKERGSAISMRQGQRSRWQWQKEPPITLREKDS